MLRLGRIRRSEEVVCHPAYVPCATVRAAPDIFPPA